MLPIKSNLIPTVSRFLEDDWKNLFEWNPEKNLTRLFSPPTNIVEFSEYFEVDIAIPGFKKECFKIEIKNQTLILTAEKANEDSSETISYIRKEFEYQKFTKLIDLNSSIMDEANISAQYIDGVLKIHIPKKEEAKSKPAKTIEIS